jgi:hypothetical protein
MYNLLLYLTIRVTKGMRLFKTSILALPAVLLLTACRHMTEENALNRFLHHQLVEWNKNLTQVVISDVLTPPVCSRAYAYSNIAAYEALRAGHPDHPSYGGKLNALEQVPQPDGNNKDYLFDVSAIIAFSTVAQKVIFNSDAVMEMEDDFLRKLDDFEVDPEKIERSVDYGRRVGQFIVEWASKDGYLQRNAFPGYIVTKETGRWQPTPPDYMDAVEPNWHTLRPFVLDSASQFRPIGPERFDTSAGSRYHENVMQVYEAVSKNDTERIQIAKFWDCNPNISVTQGHVMYFQQKISPAGHWMHVAATVCQRKDLSEIKTAEVLSKVAICIADGFINCWEAKYHYNTIRPETVINKYIDKDWQPLLQTPPFPEYPSGHSVVSGAASTMLTHLFGNNFEYIDSTEVPFGIPARKFTSFDQAANEASISRLYGGIHYLPSLNTGLAEGREVSKYIISKL